MEFLQGQTITIIAGILVAVVGLVFLFYKLKDRKNPSKAGKAPVTNTGSNKKRLFKANSVSESIPYVHVYENGVIETEENVYTVAFAITDINFKLAPEEDQVNILIKYGRFLNSLAIDASYQIVIQNKNADSAVTLNNITFLPQPDQLNTYRQELNEILVRKLAEGRNSLVFTTAVMVCFEQCKYYIARRENELYVNVAQDGENYIQEAYMVIMDLLPTYEADYESFESYARSSIDGAFRSERSGHVKSEKTKYTTIILNDYRAAKEQFLKRGIQDPTIADIARQINLKGKTRKITPRQITNALKQEKTVIGLGEVDAYTTSNAYNPEKEILMQDLKDQFAKMRTDIRLPRTAQLMIEVFAEEMTSDPELDNLTGNETIKKLMAKHGYEVSSQEAGMFLSIIQNILIKDGYHHEIKHRRNTRPRIRSTYELRTIQEKTDLENDILASLLANA